MHVLDQLSRTPRIRILITNQLTHPLTPQAQLIQSSPPAISPASHPSRLSRLHSAASSHSAVLQALGAPKLVELFVGVVGQEEGDPVCRAAAAAALEEVLLALQQAALMPGGEVGV